MATIPRALLRTNENASHPLMERSRPAVAALSSLLRSAKQTVLDFTSD